MQEKLTKLWQVFTEFLLLGCHSFGGPVAHLGYFQREFVQRRRQLSEQEFGGLVALCHFLPGPSSSQLGMAIGHRRAGVAGSIAAFLGFTLPSALLMFAAAVWLLQAPDNPWLAGAIRGLKILAVAVIADAIWQMARSLSRGYRRAAITAAVAVISIATPSLWTQIAVIAAAALCGYFWLRANPPAAAIAAPIAAPQAAGWFWLLVFALLMVLALLGFGSELFNSFFRVGSLVFGGGHVVLPLLEQQPLIQSGLSTQEFLLGYSLAQGVPGPMFTLATYLGAVVGVQNGGAIAGALIATLGIFLPGWLLLLGVLPHWQRLQASPAAAAMIAGVGAAAVGLLVAALVQPVWPSAIHCLTDLLLLAVLALGLKGLRIPIWLLLPAAAVFGGLLLT